MRHRRRMLTLLLLMCLCAFSTGCLRMAAEAFVNLAPGSAMSPHPPPSVMYTDSYFDGTKHVAPLVFTPLAPIAILDLPLEIVWDIVLIPSQVLDVYSRRIDQKRMMIANMEPFTLAQEGYFKEFKKKIRTLDSKQQAFAMISLTRSFLQDPEKYQPYVAFLYSLDNKYIGDFVLDSLDFKSDSVLTDHLFQLGLRPAVFPHEHAVFNAVKYLRLHINDRPPEYSTAKQLSRIRILLRYGCNPNSIPEYHCRYVRDFSSEDFDGETSLDMARSALEDFSNNGNHEEEALLKEIVHLLEIYGAQTAKELNLVRNHKRMPLAHFYRQKQLEYFRRRLSVATRDEKRDAMQWIELGGQPRQVFEPYCRLLLDDGIPLDAHWFQDNSPIVCLAECAPTEYYQFAFENGLKASDYPESAIVAKLCKYAVSALPEKNSYLEFLHLLLRNGFNPNIPMDQDDKTALDILYNAFRPEYPKAYSQKLVREMIDLVKKYGGVAYCDAPLNDSNKNK